MNANALASKERWETYRKLPPEPEGAILRSRIRRALSSVPVALQRRRLEAIGSRLGDDPILWKYLPAPNQEHAPDTPRENLQRLRLFFPVTAAREALEAGDVIALVLLYDVERETVLYAHPVHAGPGANPLLQHLDGPMARPKAQAGRNGDLATRRLLEHKRALWDAHTEDVQAIGAVAAARRWRARYAWSLVRLYFCERCPACRWGSPHYEGEGQRWFRLPGREPPTTASTEITSAELQSLARAAATEVEVAYAGRGGFTVADQPRILVEVDEDHVTAAFPTDAEWLDGGVLVAVVATLHRPSGEVLHAHCLAAGEEPEMLFRRPEVLGLPSLDHGGGFEAYAAWRKKAWRQFWLDELEHGLHAASQRWLGGFWSELIQLLGAKG